MVLNPAVVVGFAMTRGQGNRHISSLNGGTVSVAKPIGSIPAHVRPSRTVNLQAGLNTPSAGEREAGRSRRPS